MYAGSTITKGTPAFPALCSTIWSLVPHRRSCSFLENLLERARPAMLSLSTKTASYVVTNQWAKREVGVAGPLGFSSPRSGECLLLLLPWCWSKAVSCPLLPLCPDEPGRLCSGCVVS